MKEVVQFLFDRFQRAVAMDATNKVLGRDCKYIFEATEWRDAYKSGLSKSKQDEFDKEWRKLEQTVQQAKK